MTADGILSLMALVLAAVFIAAAVSKLRDRSGTVATMTSFKLPVPAVMAVLVPVLELGIAVGLLVSPSLGALGAVTLLIFFTTFLLLQLRLGVRTPCRCFGSAAQHPLSIADITRNLGLIALGMPIVTLLSRTTPAVLDFVAVTFGVLVAWQIQRQVRAAQG